jgi:hypothetical protein
VCTVAKQEDYLADNNIPSHTLLNSSDNIKVQKKEISISSNTLAAHLFFLHDSLPRAPSSLPNQTKAPRSTRGRARAAEHANTQRTTETGLKSADAGDMKTSSLPPL